MIGRALVAGLVLSSAASCVQVSWERHAQNTMIEPSDEEVLVAGASTLEDCLANHGAPLLIWELGEGGYAVAYGWDKQREYGVSVSLPVADSGGSASFNYDDVASKLHGIVFQFDSSHVLVRTRRGYLRDLAPDQDRRRPVYLEDE